MAEGPTKRRILVCTECLEGLVSMGAERVAGSREGSLLDRCEAHYASPPPHAMHLLIVEPETIGSWVQSARAVLPTPLAEDWELVATLATTLFASRYEDDLGDRDERPERVLWSVEVARELVAVAKGDLL